MKNNAYVFYGKIEVKLSSFLHIGGEDERFVSMVTRGDGKYILPANSIAGASRAYLQGLGWDMNQFMGSNDTSAESKICFYDASCKNVAIEMRNGVKIDEEYRVAKKGCLYSQFYLAQGMTAEICIQAYAKTEEESKTFEQIFNCIQWGIQAGELTLGAKKSNGAGLFEVLGAKCKTLDLKKTEDFKTYLSGVENVLAGITCAAFKTEECRKKCGKNVDAKEQPRVEFELLAEIPAGLLVKSGETAISETFNGEGIEVDAVNMRKTVDGTEYYFIPGSTMKGAIRGYAESVCKYFQIPKEVTEQLFGGMVASKKYRSHVKAQDVLIEQKQTAVYNRIMIDRWLGGVITGAKMNQEVVSTPEGVTVSIKVVTDMAEKKQSNLLNAFVFLALRDMGLGLVPVGSSSSVGFGRLKGNVLKVGESTLRFEDNKLVFDEEAQTLISGWLQEVEHYAV